MVESLEICKTTKDDLLNSDQGNSVLFEFTRKRTHEHNRNIRSIGETSNPGERMNLKLYLTKSYSRGRAGSTSDAMKSGTTPFYIYKMPKGTNSAGNCLKLKEKQEIGTRWSLASNWDLLEERGSDLCFNEYLITSYIIRRYDWLKKIVFLELISKLCISVGETPKR